MATPAGALAAGELARDDLPLHQELAIERLEGVDVEVRELQARRGDGGLEVRLDLRLLGPAAAVGEREIGQVAGQPDPRAHHDIALGAGAAQPFAGSSGQVVQGHACSILEAKLVSNSGGLLVIFAADGLAELGAEPKPLDRPRAMPGSLAHVPRGAVNPLEQGQEAAAEDAIVLGTAQLAARPELHELDPAIGAGELRELPHQLAHVGEDQALNHAVQGQIRGDLRQRQAGLLGTAQAKMLLPALAADPLGDVDRGLVLAPLADHDAHDLGRS